MLKKNDVQNTKDKLKDSFTDDEEKAMMEAAVHFGHRTSKLHPRMESFVVGIRNTTHIIDLKKTKEHLAAALEFIASLVKQGKVLMIVSTKLPLKGLVQAMAESCGLPYVVERWLGGTFTNFPVISKRVKYFKDLKQQKESGGFDKYTKKERIKLEKTLQDMGKKFEGLSALEKLPNAVFVCDVVKDKLMVKEAKMKGIKIIGIIDTNADPLSVDYPIPANDDAILAVRYILERVKETIVKSKNKEQG